MDSVEGISPPSNPEDTMIDIYPADETNTTWQQRSRVADIAWYHNLDAAQLLSQFTASSQFAGCIECDLNGTRYHVYPDGFLLEKLATSPTWTSTWVDIKLQAKATEAASYRGHTLNGWVQISPTITEATCTACNRTVHTNTKPAPNEIDIGGEAVALNCDPAGSRAQPVR